TETKAIHTAPVSGSAGRQEDRNTSDSYNFSASGNSTSDSYNFTASGSSGASGLALLNWDDTAGGGTQGSVNQSWNGSGSYTAHISSASDLVHQTATGTSSQSGSDSYVLSGSGTYSYPTLAGSVSGTITQNE